MPSWQGKSRGNRLGYSIFVAVLRRLGLRPAYFLLRFVSFYYFLFAGSSSGYILELYRRRLGFGYRKSLLLLYRNYYAFGQSLIDKVAVMSGMANRFSFDFDGEQHLHRMVSLGKGGLLLSSHIGNWEAAGHLLERLRTRINVVMFDGEHQKIKDYLQNVTGERTTNIIVIKDDLSHIYVINEALKNNEIVCMHADRFLEGNRVIEIPFLGKKACFPAGPFIVAAQFKTPVCFVFAMKEGTTHYHFYSSEIRSYDFSDKNETIRKMLLEFAAGMEEKVRSYPEQWYNYYDFWAQAPSDRK